jgi:bacterioferritin
MRGNPQIIDVLNARMLDELTAISQYTAHLAFVTVWQYGGLVKYLQERIDDETAHFNKLRSWVVFLGGMPATSPLNRINVGKDFEQMLLFDRTAEEVTVANYNELIALCITLKDAQTRGVIEEILEDEIDHLTDIEAQLTQIAQMGITNYLSARLA